MIRRTYEPFEFLSRVPVLGRLAPFTWVPLTVAPGTPVFSRTYSAEMEAPWRLATTWVFRVGGKFAVGVGWWHDVGIQDLDEEHKRVYTRSLDDTLFDLYVAVNGPVSREEWNAAREGIKDLALDPDEEMYYLQQQGLTA